MKKIINIICVAGGFLFLGIGIIGIILPVLPTTPFLLLAAALFAKGSEKFHKWFIKTSLYRKYIDQTVKNKAMTKKNKIKMLTTISILMIIGFLVCPIWHAKLLIAIVEIGHLYYFIFRIKTVDEEKMAELQMENEPSKETIYE